MLNLNLKPPLVFPSKAPVLNRQHPLFSQQHFIHAAVARNGGLLDMLTGTFATNTTTLGGVDENGHYIWSNDTAGTATVSMTPLNSSTSFQFWNWGCIFKFIATNRQYIWAVDSPPSGIWTNAGNITFLLVNGTVVAFPGIQGHTYFALYCNSVGTANQSRTCVLVDMTTGQVSMFTQPSLDNITVNVVNALQVSSGVCANRLYASFFCGSVLVPPAVTPAATFYSIDQIMAGISNPWSLWYA